MSQFIRETLAAPNRGRSVSCGRVLNTEARGGVRLQAKREVCAEALMNALPDVDGRRSWKAETEAMLLPRCGRKCL